MDASADCELDRWGSYMRGIENLGYPRSTIEARMKEGVLTLTRNNHDPDVPEDIALTEWIICQISTTSPHLRDVALIRYTTSGDNKAKAHRLGQKLKRKIARRTYEHMITQLHERYLGFKAGVEININNPLTAHAICGKTAA